jgi:hypothetical protein
MKDADLPVTAGTDVGQADSDAPQVRWLLKLRAVGNRCRMLCVRKRANCLRCAGIELVHVEPFDPDIKFFGCPACHRQYALEPGKAITFRWLHPISVVLYPILFGIGSSEALPWWSEPSYWSEPSTSPEVRWRMIREIELAQPTQQVRDILGNPQTEQECREYLQRYVEEARRFWTKYDEGNPANTPAARADSDEQYDGNGGRPM